MIIDAENKVMGRLASEVAQLLQDGEEVHIINAEKAVISGKREELVAKYRAKRRKGSRDHGPYYPKAPERMLKRSVRGMLPKNHTGRECLKRLRTYPGNPEGWEAESIDVRAGEELKGRKYITLAELAADI